MSADDKEKSKPLDPEDTGEIEVPPEIKAKAEFYISSNEQLFDDSLEKERLLDLEKLAPIISDKSGLFDEKVLESEVDPAVVQRLYQYEAEKDLNAAPKEAFYQDTGMISQVQEDETRLRDEQQVLLSAVQRLTDGHGFEEAHPDLHRDDMLRPITQGPAIDYDAPAIPEPEAPAPKAAPDFSGAGVQANLTWDKMQVLTGEKDSLEMLERARQPHAMVGYEGPRRAPGMSVEMKIAIGLVALAIPLFGWSIYLQTNANAQADKQQQEAALSMTDETVDRNALVNRMQEPFRMPASSPGPQGGVVAIGGGDNSSGVRREGGDGTSWKPPANPSPEPSPQQMEANRKIVLQAEQMSAIGKGPQALSLLSAALGKAPGDVNLVMATARAYMAARDFVTARNILQAAMRGARTFADWNLLNALLMQVPAQS